MRLSGARGAQGGLAIPEQDGRPPAVHAPKSRDGDGGQHQGFRVGADAMRRRCRWWFFWAAIWGSVAGVVGLFIFIMSLPSLPRQPPDVTDLLEKLQLGMDQVDVEDIRVPFIPRQVRLTHPWDVCFMNCDNGWMVRVELGSDGKLIDKRPIAPKVPIAPESFWRRTWSYWQYRIRWLPNLPF
jgi:hypothetical protein